MNIADMVIPRPKAFFVQPEIACEMEKINWIEGELEYEAAAELINKTLVCLDESPRPFHAVRMNISPRRKIRLLKSAELSPEEYVLTINNEKISIAGGSLAGIMHGAESFCQILVFCSEHGGLDRTVPVGKIHDWPRFEYRGIMVDSARHFQKKELILSILDEMSHYKLNKFHWHLTDRQSWRLPLKCEPELIRNVPHSRAYSYGAYTFDEVREIREYAEKRGIQIIPELEMPGHSNAVFFTHPELACQTGEDPYASDYWEFCLGNPKVKDFLSRILDEMAELFPNSSIIHIGGDEAGVSHWQKCKLCQKKMQALKTDAPRKMEAAFMSEMESVVHSLGRTAMSWGKNEGSYELFSKNMIVQNWLLKDVSTLLGSGLKVVNSFMENCYLDFPFSEDNGDLQQWQKKIYDFDPTSGASGDVLENLLGGEACLWTEQIPQWRVLARLLPRMRAFSEALWCAPEQKDYQDFLERESHLCGTMIFRYR